MPAKHLTASHIRSEVHESFAQLRSTSTDSDAPEKVRRAAKDCLNKLLDAYEDSILADLTSATELYQKLIKDLEKVVNAARTPSGVMAVRYLAAIVETGKEYLKS
ncbi:MAG: hypothetical protein HS108_14375 [Planctomycetes bacterium]|nr:hypothetical protein [Planctomycetota bacterium]